MKIIAIIEIPYLSRVIFCGTYVFIYAVVQGLVEIWYYMDIAYTMNCRTSPNGGNLLLLVVWEPKATLL